MNIPTWLAPLLGVSLGGLLGFKAAGRTEVADVFPYVVAGAVLGLIAGGVVVTIDLMRKRN